MSKPTDYHPDSSIPARVVEDYYLHEKVADRAYKRAADAGVGDTECRTDAYYYLTQPKQREGLHRRDMSAYNKKGGDVLVSECNKVLKKWTKIQEAIKNL